MISFNEFHLFRVHNRSFFAFLFKTHRHTMALEAYASQNPGEIHGDVLLQARLSCYKARDAFYTCLEKNSNKKPTEIASVGLLYPVECRKTRDEFVKQCRPTWVKHFDRQYCAKRRVQRHLDDNESRRGV